MGLEIECVCTEGGSQNHRPVPSLDRVVPIYTSNIYMMINKEYKFDKNVGGS